MNLTARLSKLERETARHRPVDATYFLLRRLSATGILRQHPKLRLVCESDCTTDLWHWLCITIACADGDRIAFEALHAQTPRVAGDRPADLPLGGPPHASEGDPAARSRSTEDRIKELSATDPDPGRIAAVAAAIAAAEARLHGAIPPAAPL